MGSRDTTSHDRPSITTLHVWCWCFGVIICRHMHHQVHWCYTKQFYQAPSRMGEILGIYIDSCRQFYGRFLAIKVYHWSDQKRLNYRVRQGKKKRLMAHRMSILEPRSTNSGIVMPTNMSHIVGQCLEIPMSRISLTTSRRGCRIMDFIWTLTSTHTYHNAMALICKLHPHLTVITWVTNKKLLDVFDGLFSWVDLKLQQSFPFYQDT